MDAKNHARDAALRYVTANFPKAFAQRPDQRHSDRPGILHVLDILADDPAILFIERFKPFPNWFSA
jgi:hypothetical protein